MCCPNGSSPYFYSLPPSAIFPLVPLALEIELRHDLAATLSRRPQTANILPHRIDRERSNKYRAKALQSRMRNSAMRKLAAAAKSDRERAPRLDSISAARVIADLERRVSALEARLAQPAPPPPSPAQERAARLERQLGPALYKTRAEHRRAMAATIAAHEAKVSNTAPDLAGHVPDGAAPAIHAQPLSPSSTSANPQPVGIAPPGPLHPP